MPNMEYCPHMRFDLEHALSKNKIDNQSLWRCFHIEFIKLPQDTEIERLA
jgi:hypothetical protein